MKALYNAVADFVKKDFNGSVYGITILFLAVAMFINYSKGIDLNWFDTREGFNSRLGYYGLLFGGTYFITTLLAAKGAEKAYLKDWRFWILAISFVFIATSFMKIEDGRWAAILPAFEPIPEPLLPHFAHLAGVKRG